MVLVLHNLVTERQPCFITKISWYGLYRLEQQSVCFVDYFLSSFTNVMAFKVFWIVKRDKNRRVVYQRVMRII